MVWCGSNNGKLHDLKYSKILKQVKNLEKETEDFYGVV